MSNIYRRYAVAGCRGGSLVLEHLSPKLTLSHGVALRKSREPLFLHQNTGNGIPGPPHQAGGRPVRE